MDKIGRNDPCPCGSDKKYKKCCLGSVQQESEKIPQREIIVNKNIKKQNNISLYEKNLILLEGIVSIFGVDRGRDWKEIKREISKEHVRELYKLIAWLWPPETDIASTLPEPEDNLRGLYLGYMHPESVLEGIARHSLYCDQILVVSPFMNPWCVVEKYSPLIHPEEYIADTIKWVIFMLRLAPWIGSRHVLLIPDPGDFDYSLRRKTWELAGERLKDKPLAIDKDLEKYAETDFKRMFLATPADAMKKRFKESHPKMTEEELEGMMKYIERLKDCDPYFPTNPNESGMFGLHTQQTGANLEMGTFIAKATGSYLYTDFNSRWEEIGSIATGDIDEQETWGPVSRAFQGLNFRFLNKVDPEFANIIRQDGRLEGFRNTLRKTWNSVSSSVTPSKGDILSFKDEIIEMHHKAEVDWKKIDADLIKWTMGESGIGGIITGGIDWRISAAGFSIAAIGQLISARYKRIKFRKDVPMSVFIDLKNKK